MSLILGKVGSTTHEDFTVVDAGYNLISGLTDGDFTNDLFDPSGASVGGSVLVTVSELGNGHYRASFIPNEVGMWYLSIYHATHFPWGKVGSIQAFSNDFDTIADVCVRILGLTQENFFMDNCVHNAKGMLTSGIIRTYSNPTSVGTGADVLATYQITATYQDGTQLINYKVERVS